MQIVCKALSGASLSDEDLVRALRHAVDVYYNHTGSATCYNTSTLATPDLGGHGWDIQVSSYTSLIEVFCLTKINRRMNLLKNKSLNDFNTAL